MLLEVRSAAITPHLGFIDKWIHNVRVGVTHGSGQPIRPSKIKCIREAGKTTSDSDRNSSWADKLQ